MIKISHFSQLTSSVISNKIGMNRMRKSSREQMLKILRIMDRPGRVEISEASLVMIATKAQ